MDLYLGLDLGRWALKVAVTDDEGRLVARASRPHRGDPVGALAELGLKKPQGAPDLRNALATGVGASLLARELGSGEMDGLSAAAEGARALVSDAAGVLVLGAEEALLASLPPRERAGSPVRDIRFAQSCACGVGAFLARWTPLGTGSQARTQSGAMRSDALAEFEGRVSSMCVSAAESDLRSLSREGVPGEVLSALAVRSAARILAAGLVQGALVGRPVALLGGPALAQGFARALAEELGLGPGELAAPEAAEFGQAFGASLLARSRGRPFAHDRLPLAESSSPSAGAWRPISSSRPPHRDRSLAELARAVAADGAGRVLVLDEEEMLVVRASGDGMLSEAVYAPACSRSVGRALGEVAVLLGSRGAEELGRLARGAEGPGSYLRDRCAETLRADAGERLASGEPREAVARGALEAVARAARRAFGRLGPADGEVLLAGELADLSGLDEILSREFGCRFRRMGAAPRVPAEAESRGGAAQYPSELGTGDLLGERERMLREHTPLRARGRWLASLGLPLSLGMADGAPFWANFLVELGFDVVTLDGPPPPALAPRAAARTAGEPCGALVGLRAETEALARSGVDAIFLPVEVDAPSEKGPFAYRCPFLQAAAHLSAPPAEIVRPIVFRAFSETLSERSLARGLSPWRIAPGAIGRALRVAQAAAERFRRGLRLCGEGFLQRLGEGGRAVALLGRSYSLQGLGPAVRRALESALGPLVPLDMLPVSDSDLDEAAKAVSWDCGRRLLAAARFVSRDERFSAVWLTHIRCGPDSFVLKHARTILADSRWTVLELGLEAGEERLLERARAFAASCAPRRAERAPSRSEPSGTKARGGRRTVYFPDMGVASEAAVATLSGFSISAEILRHGESCLRAAAKCTSGGECLPYVLATGCAIEAALRPGFDPAASAFFMASSSGSCRFSQYARGLRGALDSLGLGEVPIISLNQSEGHTRQMPGLAFARLLWKGMTALGELEAAALHLRPRALDPGAVTAALEESREDVLGCLRSRRSPFPALARSARRLGAVRLDPGALPVLVAVTGEIFARSSPFANSDLVRLIEEAGGEALMPPFQEWIYHVNRCVWLLARSRGRTVAAWGLRGALGFLRRTEAAARRSFRMPHPPPVQPSLEEVWRAAREAGFVPWFGDASLALGRAIAARLRGARAVVNIVPFGCLPGTTAEAVFAARRAALGGMPVLHLHVDGNPRAAVREKIRSLVGSVRG